MNVLVFLLLLGTVTFVKGGEKNEKEKLGEKPPPQRDCLHQCIQDLVVDLQEGLGKEVTETLFRFEMIAVFKLFSNTDNFKNFCKGFMKMETCIKTCPISFLGEIAKQGGQIIEYYCVDKYAEIMEHFPCMTTVAHDMVCIDECHDKYYGSVKTLTKRFGHLLLLGDTERTENLFGDLCRYVTCSYDCELPITRQTCGPKTTDLVVELVSYAFKVLQNLALGTGVIGNIPQSCVMLGNYTVKILPTTTHFPTIPPPKLPKRKPTAAAVTGHNPKQPVVINSETVNGPSKGGLSFESRWFFNGLLSLIVLFIAL